MFLPEFVDVFTVIAHRDGVPYIVNHNLSPEDMNTVVSEVRRRRETVTVLKQKDKHALDGDFICSGCKEFFKDRDW